MNRIARTPRSAVAALRFDAAAGFVAGILVSALHPWLAVLYRLPTRWVLFLGVMNLAYAGYSGTLARRASRGRPLRRSAIDFLLVANTAWGVLCTALFVSFWPTASPWGLTHLLGEATFLFALVAYELRVLRPAIVT